MSGASPIVVVAVAVIAFGAVARITRFLNSDVLAGPIRAWAIRRWGPDSQAATLIECPWCASIWIAAAVIPLAWWFGTATWFALPAAVLSASYAYGLLASNLDS